ncbi:unnamed protein product [Ilex paraguariensis]|uniref:ELM2 domain-containing protein n=1 Tax=Ilex paraguariensis TaxID=185542 RepID=A0ABC8UFG3_9AQUA
MKMTVSRVGKEEKNDKGSSPKGGDATQRKFIFGRYADVDMLSQLKALALDPCNSELLQDEISPLRDQTLTVRNLMALSDTEFPWRKRKLHQFLKDKFGVVPVLASGVSNQQKVTILNIGQLSQTSSISSLLNSVGSTESLGQKPLLTSHSSSSLLTFEDDFQEKQLSSDFSFMDYATDWSPPNSDVSPLVDSDESITNTLSPENLTIQDTPSMDLGDSVHSLSSSELVSKQTHLQKPRQSIWFSNFIGDHFQRMAIPVGPHFQADVPDWTGPFNKGILNSKICDPETSRWFGTRLWPIEDKNKKQTGKAVGKGRSDSCLCMSPGSTDCINFHIFEERFLLQYELGPTFLSWKFDEMGEVVSKTWTLKEQQSFESLVKVSLSSNGKKFLKLALECFPYKCRRSILSYYFNVFIPRHMSVQIRSSLEEVDSDDDKVRNIKYMGLMGRHNARSTIRGSSKNMKTQYLRQRS